MRYLLPLVLAAAILTAPHIEHVSAGVLAAFDGAPSAPQPFSQHPEYGGYDVQVHRREMDSAYGSLAAEHGADCAGPPATHQIGGSYANAVFVCNDHLMTALREDGYGVIYVTPNQILTLANGSVTFDLSTHKSSVRDWWDVLITPYAENLARPLLSDLSQGVDLQGPPRNAIHIGTDNGEGAPVLKIVRNGAVQYFQAGWQVSQPSEGIAPGTNQAATRQSFRFTAQGGRMRFERLASATAPGLVFWDVAATAPFTSGIVQFGHHSYTPTKDNAGTPNTWHWDNLAVGGGTPFSIQHATPRELRGAGTLAFPPAPAGAMLRFAAICAVRVNGTPVAPQLTAEAHHPEHASSYFVPIPAGSTSAAIAFQADAGYSGPCSLQDATVWAQDASGSPPTPTETPTLGPTPTLPATPTATMPVPTSTATPQTYRCQRRQPDGSYVTLWTQAVGRSCP